MIFQLQIYIQIFIQANQCILSSLQKKPSFQTFQCFNFLKLIIED
jgi:hypothetical protein